MGTCLGALLCLSAALFAPARVSLIAFPGIGLFARCCGRFTGAQLCCGVPRLILGQIEHRYHWGCGGTDADRPDRRLRGTAQWHGISLCHV